MGKEIRHVYTYQPEGIPAPYADFIRQRNGNIALVISGMLGVPLKTNTEPVREDIGMGYCVPAVPLTEASAGNFEVVSKEHIYGVAVRDAIHTFKSQLHSTPDSNGSTPEGYSARFAEAIKDTVLPGGVFFTAESGNAVFNRLMRAGYPVLLKDPAESDFNGQYNVKSKDELDFLVSGFPAERIRETGLILEAKLENPKTLSVGHIFFDGAAYSLIARQKDIEHKGRKKFGGGEILMVQGEIDDLLDFTDTPEESDAIRKSELAFNSFGEVDPIAVARMSFDVVRGSISGIKYSGITDITARVGGYTAAEVLAIRHLRNNYGLKYVKAKSELIYDPKGEYEGVVFVDHPELKIVASLI